jgi:hypothetical protein
MPTAGTAITQIPASSRRASGLWCVQFSQPESHMLGVTQRLVDELADVIVVQLVCEDDQGP